MSNPNSSFTQGAVKSSHLQAALRSALKGGTLPFLDTFDFFVGMVPIWGFGEFITTSSPDYSYPMFYPSDPYVATDYFSGDKMVDLWPQVYTKLTEVWTQSDGATLTKTTEWNNFYDIPINVTAVGGGVSAPSASLTLISITSTSVNYIYSLTSGVTGTYVATLSAQADNISNWATLSAQADAIQVALTDSDLATITIAAGLSKIRGAFGCPTSTGGVVKTAFQNPFLGCVSSYGVPARFTAYDPYSPTPPADGSVIVLAKILATNIDERISTQLSSVNNMGCVISSRSKWKLVGSAPAEYGGDSANYNVNDHDKVYMQSVDISGGSVAMDATISLAPYFSNPISGIKSFASSDAPANTGTDYGMLGFRGTAV